MCGYTTRKAGHLVLEHEIMLDLHILGMSFVAILSDHTHPELVVTVLVNALKPCRFPVNTRTVATVAITSISSFMLESAGFFLED